MALGKGPVGGFGIELCTRRRTNGFGKTQEPHRVKCECIYALHFRDLSNLPPLVLFGPQPKADVQASERSRVILALTNHIIATYGCNAESLAIRDPRNANHSIRITRDRLYIWARAMMQNAPDVDLDNPPLSSDFPPEDKRIETLDKARSRAGFVMGAMLDDAIAPS